jgi:hypothetical protein
MSLLLLMARMKAISTSKKLVIANAVPSQKSYRRDSEVLQEM